MLFRIRFWYNFTETIGDSHNVWIMGYPHWVDTRLVAITSGYPFRDYALFVDQIDSTSNISDPKMFIIHPHDKESLQALTAKYPSGWVQLYDSEVESKDFLIYYVPPKGTG